MLLIKFATRSRPEKFRKTFEVYHDLLEGDDYRFHVSIDEDDVMVNHITEIVEKPNTEVFLGKPRGKIEAINRDIFGDWDILLWAQDDMIPQVHGFNKIIEEDMNKYFPDGDGVLWYNDGHQGDKCCTLVVMGRKYYDRFDYIYHPDYRGMWCDNEYGDVAKRLGKIQYIDNVIIEHQHPVWTGEKYDQMLRRDEAFWKQDEATYLRRKTLNFDL